MTYENAKWRLEFERNRVCTECDPLGYGCSSSCRFCDTRTAYDTAIEALDRQIPKKPVFGATKKYKNIFDGSEVEVHELESCPVCGCYPLETNYVRLPSCPKCNQKIEWRDGK